MKIHKTTEGEFIVVSEEGEFAFNSAGQRIPGITGEITNTLRSDSKVYKEIKKAMDDMKKVSDTRTIVERIKGFEVFLNKEDYSLNIDINGEIVGIDQEGINKLKSQVAEVEKIKLSISTASGYYNLGDRVLLYGPTGTGKTYDFLDTVKAMVKTGKLDDYDVVTITEGFEDIDFLAHIVPTPTGIKYSEKKIITLLRDASNGKRVAILLDELNRGSKSFLNLMLKLLDAVDGENYVLSNFIKDETIVIPIKNVLFFATMNLGGKYVGTNVLDEALFDRFNIVQYKGYNPDVEKEIIKAFGTLGKEVTDIVKYVRDIHRDGEIRMPISTRGVKMWAESFINTGKTKEDLIGTFQLVLLNRLTSVDDIGNPNREEESLILKRFKDLKIIS